MYLQQGKRGHRTSRELTRALNQAGKNPRDGDQDADDAEGKAEGDTEAPKQPKFSTFCLRQSHLGQAVNTSEGKRGEKSAGLGTRRKHECLRKERERPIIPQAGPGRQECLPGTGKGVVPPCCP